MLSRHTPSVELGSTHGSLQVAFADPADFGYVEDVNNVTGFHPHGLWFPFSERWPRVKIARIELVSLLKLPTPAVYLSNDLPNMQQLATAPVRPLDAFEERNLTKLIDGGDLEVEEFPDRTRMLGSIRAASQCVQCHAVSRGALLGAFSYVLPSNPAPQVKPASTSLPNAQKL